MDARISQEYTALQKEKIPENDKKNIINFVKNTFRKKKADDVKVVFFGPSEKAFSSSVYH